MDRTNWIRYILTATDRASRQVLASDAAIRKSVKDTQSAASASASRQSSMFSKVARDAEGSSRRVTRSMDNQSRASKAARDELRKFGFEQTKAWRAGAAFDNHLRNTNLHLTRLRQSMRNLAVPALVAAFTTLAQAAAAGAGGITALVGALEPLGGLAATLPGGVIGLAQAFGTLFGAISPVKQAITDYMTMWKSAATQEQSAEKRLFSAAKAIKSAQQQVHDATLETAEANRTLTQSQYDVERAQNELNKAVSDGKREMVDLKNAAIDAALSQQQAGLTLRQAIADMQKTELDPHATMLEVEQARLAVRQAKQGAREASIEAQRAQAENERARTGGVDKLPNVIAAKRALVDAERSAADAARGVTKAEVGVKRALEQVANAHKQATMASSHQASQLVNLRYDLAQLSPAAKQFAIFMAKFIQGPISNLEKAAQTAFLPKLEKGILKASGVFPVLSRAAKRTGSVLGALSIEAGRLMGSTGFGKQLEKVTDNNSRVMRILGRAALQVARGMMQVAVAARPLTTWLARLVKHWADFFASTMQADRASGRLTKKFEETKAIVKRLVDITKNLFVAFNNILHISKPLGDSMFGAFDRASRKFKEWTESAKGKTQIERFFERIKPALFEAGRLFSDLVTGLAQMGMTSGLAPLIHQMRVELLPAILEVAEGFSSAFGPGIINLLTSVLQLFNALGHPLTTMLNVTAGIVDGFAAIVKYVPGMKQLLSIIIGISLASRAISFVSAISGVSALVGKLRDVRSVSMAAAGAEGRMTSRAGLTGAVNAAKVTFAEPGLTPEKPLFVFVVNEMFGGAPPILGGVKGKKGSGLILPPGVAATTVAGEGEAVAGTAAKSGIFSRIIRSPKTALAGGAAGTAALIGGSMIPGKVPGTGVGVGEAVSNIGTGAALGATLAPETLGVSIAVGAALGALLTFRKQVGEAFKWLVDFVKKHSLIVAAAIGIMFAGLPLLVYAAWKFRKEIADVLGGAFDWIVNAGGDIVDFFKKLPGRIVSGIEALPGLLWDVLKATPRMLGRFVGFWLTLPFRITVIVVRMVGKVKDLITNLGPKLFHWGIDAIAFLAKAWWQGVKTLVGFWLKLPGRILHAIQTLPGKIFHFGGHTMGRLQDGLTHGAVGIIRFVAGLPGRIVTAIGKLGSKIYAAGKDFAKEFARGVYDELPSPIRDGLGFTKDAIGGAVSAVNPFDDKTVVTPHLQGPDTGDNAHKKARKNWKDTADQAKKSADEISRKARGSFNDQAHSAADGGGKVRKATTESYAQARKAAGNHLDGIRTKNESTFKNLVSTANHQGQNFRKAVDETYSGAEKVLHRGLSYFETETNKGLKAFNIKPVKLGLTSPHGAKGGKGKGGKTVERAQGGTVTVPGAGLHDTVPITSGQIAAMVAPGEDLIVANRHQRPLLDMAVENTFGVGGIDGFFSAFDRPHYAATGSANLVAATRSYAGGGVLRTSNVILPPNTSPIHSLEAKLSKLGFEITSGMDGTHAPNSYHYKGEALDYGNSVNNLSRLASVVWPIRKSAAELFMPLGVPHGGLYHYGSAFSDPSLQAEHEDHIHIAIANAVQGALGRAGTGGVGLPRAARKAVKELRDLKVKGMEGPLSGMTEQAFKMVRAGAVRELTKRSGGVGGPEGFKVSGRGVEATIARAVSKAGGNKIAAAGVIGNAYRESLLDPTAVGTGGGGLFGFTAGEISLSALQSAADRAGVAWGNPQFQTEFMLRHGGRSLLPTLNKASTPGESARIFMEQWERPGIPALAEREWAARRAYSRGYARGGTIPRTMGAARRKMRFMGNRTAARGGAMRAPVRHFARGGTLPSTAIGSVARTSFLKGASDEASKSVDKLASSVLKMGLAARHAAAAASVKPTTFTPNLELSVLPPSAPFSRANTADARNINKKFGTAASPFPFAQFGFSSVPLFDWEKFKKDAHWKAAEQAAKNALQALGKIPADKFKKWIPILEGMNFQRLGQVLGQLKVLIESQAENLKKLIDGVKAKTKDLLDKATSKKGPGGERITKAEHRAIEKAQKEAAPGIEKARDKLKQTRAKSRVAQAIRKPLVSFHNAIQGLSVGQLNASQQQIEQQVAQVKKGGVSKKERGKLKRLQAMLEDVTNTITEHIKQVLLAAEHAVEGAAFAHNMADLGLQHLELEQQLSGTSESVQGKEARAAYIRSQVIPTLQAEQSALESQLAAARELGGEEGEKLAMQIAEEIAGVQNGILQAQLEAQELTAAEVGELNDAIAGTLGFSFQSQQFTDLIGLGVGT